MNINNINCKKKNNGSVDTFLLKAGRRELMGREVVWTAKYCLWMWHFTSCFSFFCNISMRILVIKRVGWKTLFLGHPNPDLWIYCWISHPNSDGYYSKSYNITQVVFYKVLSAEGISQLKVLSPDHKCLNKYLSGIAYSPIILKTSFCSFDAFHLLPQNWQVKVNLQR